MLKLPKWIFDLLIDFLMKIQIDVNLNAKIIDSKQNALNGDNRHQVVLLSHGLGAHRQFYTIYAQEIVSWGGIVISAEHEEPIQLAAGTSMEEIYNVRRKYLEKRHKQMMTLYEVLEDQKYLQSIFETDKPININFDTITIMGHSYGGATAI